MKLGISAQHRVYDFKVEPKQVAESELRAYAAEGDAGALVAALAQITGDITVLDKYAPHLKTQEFAGFATLLPKSELPPEQLQELVDELVESLCKDPQTEYVQVLEEDDFINAISLVVGEPVPQKFMGVLLEQGGFAPSKPVIERQTAPQEEQNVIILGAGMSGLAAAMAVADAGFTYKIMERSAQIGGTWWKNRYPGIAVDTPSIYYSLSHELEPGWSRYFPTGAEYQQYLLKVVEKYGLEEHISFNSEITGMRWDEDQQKWEVFVRRGDTTQSEWASFIITAAGFLNTPKIPKVPGLQEFEGVSIHSTQWSEKTDVKGKRVAIVGAGATAVQIVDAIIGEVDELTVYQRQPHWVRPNVIGEGLVPEAETWLQTNLPFYDRWQRAKAYWFVSDKNYDAVRVDPNWVCEQNLSISKQNAGVLESVKGHLQNSFADRPDLLKKLTPNFPPHGKRMVRDPGGYYRALRSAKTTVNDSALNKIDSNSITTADGSRSEVDVIIWATGFTLDFLSTIEIEGRDGIRLAEQWANNNPRAYKGGTVPNFPNLFITSAPNSSSGHGGGHNFMTEVTQHFILECMQHVIEEGAGSIEVTREAEAEYYNKINETMAGSVWAHKGEANTYYLNEAGRVILPNPWPMVDYWQMNRAVDPEAFILKARK